MRASRTPLVAPAARSRYCRRFRILSICWSAVRSSCGASCEGGNRPMAVQDETRRAVETYFAAWTTGNVDAAYAVLADDLTFVGPTASYQSAEAFRPALKNFAAMTKGARIVELLVQDDRAAMLYE